MAEPSCPFCNSTSLFKAGFRFTRAGERIQRYLCRECGRRFSPSLSPRSEVEFNVAGKLVEMPDPGEDHAERPFLNPLALEPGLEDPTLPEGEDPGSHGVSNLEEGLNTLPFHIRSSRGRSENNPPADEQGMNNPEGVAKSPLVLKPGKHEGETAEKWAGEIIGFAWWLKKQGRSEATIRTYCWMLRWLVGAGANLEDSESVKETLARLNRSDNWKSIAVKAYSSFLSMKGRSWVKPSIKTTQKMPFIPLEREIDDLIAGCGRKTSALLQLLKETGMRIGEALRLKWTEVDFERRIITLNQPEKNSNPRIFKMSPRLAEMLSLLPKTSERVFPTSYMVAKNSLKVARKRLAKQLGNPRLLRITFHTFRHWKATMEYHKTKDIMLVREMLGHKRIDNTLRYVQVEHALFGSDDNAEFTARIAKTIEEAKELVEAGFEYVHEKDGLMLFRRRK